MPVELYRFGFRTNVPARNIPWVTRNVSRVAISQPVLQTASEIPYRVKTLDAVHLGTAMYLQDDAGPHERVSVLVTYAATMARVGSALGFEVISPGS